MGPSGALTGETQSDATNTVETRESEGSRRAHVASKSSASTLTKRKGKKKKCVGCAVGTYWSQWEGKTTGGSVMGTRCVTNWWSKGEWSTITGAEPGMEEE